MNMPDLTKAQVSAYVATIATFAQINFGLDISDRQQAWCTTIVVAALVIGHLLSDMGIRIGRSKALAAVANENTAKLNAITPGTFVPTPTLGSSEDLPTAVSTLPDEGDEASAPS